MKKRIAIVVITLVIVATSALAAGGKNQIRHTGDIGQGSVIQNQVQVNR